MQANFPNSTQSIWIATASDTNYPSLEQDLTTDVAVLGGGIAGLSAAFFLKQAGLNVAVVESQKIVQGVTGNTTAKVTSLHNLIYSHLTQRFGEEKAQLYGMGNQLAIEQIATISQEYNIDCDFSRAQAYVYTEHDEFIGQIEKEVDITTKLGLPATFTTQTELPFPVKAAIAFQNQAYFHPRKYLLGLARQISGNGSYIFEHTRALDVEEGSPCTVVTDKGTIKANYIVIATHHPFPLKGFYFARMHLNRSYAIGVELKEKVMNGMYINLGPVIRSFRPHPSETGQILIIGGEDHVPGHVRDTTECYKSLEEDAKRLFEVSKIPYRWSAQDNMTVDKVPYIGKLTQNTPHIYVATGFNEWGMTHGTLSGLILRDQILGKENPYSAVFDPARHDILSCPLQFASQNLVVAKDFITGHLSLPVATDVSDLQKGQGQIVRKGLKKIAAYRDETGKLHCLSPVCTHLKCIVEWNAAEKTWDCPCHGARYNYDGKVIQGPAVKDLSPIEE